MNASNGQIMRVKVLAGPPGCGKTETMLAEAASAPGRYLFAAPTVDLLKEQAARWKSLVPNATCIPIHSDGQRGPVGRRIGELPARFGPGSHAAAFITHEAMLSTDLIDFAGWHARIDEPPNAIQSGVINLSASVAAFRNDFELVPFEAGWSRMRPLRRDFSWRDFTEDSMWRSLSDFRKLTARPHGVFLKAGEWAEAVAAPTQWFSLWTPLEAQSFESVTIAGAGFLSSTSYKAMLQVYPEHLAFDITSLQHSRTLRPDIRLHYFTSGHRGSTTFWGTSEGRECLVRVEEWLSRNVGDLAFWSGNEAVRHSFEHRLAGQMANPKVAGLNCFRHATSCGFIYSSKALPDDKALMEVFGLSKAEIHEARESEDIFQFVMRGAIREADFSGVYDVYLYSADQASRLRERLRASGFSDIEIVPIYAAGIMDRQRLQAGRAIKTVLSPDERNQRKKEQDAERQRRLRARRKAEACAGNQAILNA